MDGTGDENTLEIARLRAETPGCEGQIFFNNAGASLQPRAVVERVVEHLRLEERVGGYEAAEAVSDESAGVYASVARLLGARREEIGLAESATRAWDMAFYGMRFAPGDLILTGENEYASNYIAFLQAARRTGVEIEVVGSDQAGLMDLPALERALDRHGNRVKLVALTHVATNSGAVQPAREVGQRARAAGVPFLLDACQSAGQIPLSVGELGCDMLSATGRKYLRGPRGTGFLYVRSGFMDRLEPPMLDMHAAEWTSTGNYKMRGDARRFESWEASAALRLGLGRAVEYAITLGIDRIGRRVQALAERLREGLRGVDGITVTDRGRERCGIVTFTVPTMDPEAVMRALAQRKIAVRFSPRSATRLEMERRGLEAVVRASVHYYNTEDEVERFCEAVGEL